MPLRVCGVEVFKLFVNMLKRRLVTWTSLTVIQAIWDCVHVVCGYMQRKIVTSMLLLWWVCVDAVFLFQKLQLLFFLLCVHFLESSVCIVVEDHQVSIADIEAWQMVTSILGIKDVLIDDISCSSRFWCVPCPDLTNWSIFPKDIIHFLGCDLVRKVPDVQDSVYLRR